MRICANPDIMESELTSGKYNYLRTSRKDGDKQIIEFCIQGGKKERKVSNSESTIICSKMLVVSYINYKIASINYYEDIEDFNKYIANVASSLTEEGIWIYNEFNVIYGGNLIDIDYITK